MKYLEKFNHLSADIKAIIIDQIRRPTDLKAICLVNKELHELAVKPLYRNVSLDLGSSNDAKLSAFLHPSNIGLKHVRQLRLYLANVRDVGNQEQQAHLVTKMILEFLPEDVLEEFSWCPWKPFSTENLLLLYRKQKKMKWLEAMDLTCDVLPELKRNSKMRTNIFRHAKRLALYPENRETLRLCGFFVEHTAHALEDLVVHANFCSSTDPLPRADFIELSELNDSPATGPGLVSSSIFGHMMSFDKCEPFKHLTSLRIHKINLRQCADTWCKFIDFTRIEYLRVYQCRGADTLIGQLCKAAHLPRKLKSFEFQHKDAAENEALMALDGFLCIVSGIKDLVIDLLHVKSLPQTAAIVRHSKTLELLSVHGSLETGTGTGTLDDGEELFWSSEDFDKICTACTHLEQLSCAWPPTSLLRTRSDSFTAYERACGKLQQLVTLHMSTWPSCKPTSQLLPRLVYETLLQSLARELFFNAAFVPVLQSDEIDTVIVDVQQHTEQLNTLFRKYVTKCKLRLVAFGISDKIYERQNSKNQLIYLHSTAKASTGEDMIFASPITWTLRQYTEPRSEILDFVLHRESKPPCRDLRDGMVGWGGDDDDECRRTYARYQACQHRGPTMFSQCTNSYRACRLCPPNQWGESYQRLEPGELCSFCQATTPNDPGMQRPDWDTATRFEEDGCDDDGRPLLAAPPLASHPTYREARLSNDIMAELRAAKDRATRTMLHMNATLAATNRDKLEPLLRHFFQETRREFPERLKDVNFRLEPKAYHTAVLDKRVVRDLHDLSDRAEQLLQVLPSTPVSSSPTDARAVESLEAGVERMLAESATQAQDARTPPPGGDSEAEIEAAAKRAQEQHEREYRAVLEHQRKYGRRKLPKH